MASLSSKILSFSVLDTCMVSLPLLWAKDLPPLWAKRAEAAKSSAADVTEMYREKSFTTQSYSKKRAKVFLVSVKGGHRERKRGKNVPGVRKTGTPGTLGIGMASQKMLYL